MEQFKDKVVIVTGGASGIGRAISEKMAAAGALLTIADINLEQAQNIAQQINTNGGRAEAILTDVAQHTAVKKLIDDTFVRYGRIDYLFNNAGFAVVGETQDLAVEHWEKQLSVNLMGVIYGTTEAYRLMVKQGFGHIVNTASLAGLIGFPGSVPYATSKHAVWGLSRSLRAEGRAYNVKVTAICPGFVESNIYDTAVRVNTPSEEYRKAIPFKIIPTARAADIILKGVLDDREIIVFPFYARLFWWVSVNFPAITRFFYARSVQKYRDNKKNIAK